MLSVEKAGHISDLLFCFVLEPRNMKLEVKDNFFRQSDKNGCLHPH